MIKSPDPAQDAFDPYAWVEALVEAEAAIARHGKGSDANADDESAEDEE